MVLTYTASVAEKHAKAASPLAEALKELRADAGITQAKLARLAGTSMEPIKSIETEGHVPKASTLRQLADGLATYAPGRRDPELADEYYERLMRAAGYVAPVRGTPGEYPEKAQRPNSIEEDIAAMLRRDPEISIALTKIARGATYANEDDLEFIRDGLRLIASRAPQPPTER